MDAGKMSIKNIKYAIDMKAYEITGILATGEITVAIVSDTDKMVLDLIFKKPKSNKKRLRVLDQYRKLDGESSNGLKQIYRQRICKNGHRTNGLRHR